MPNMSTTHGGVLYYVVKGPREHESTESGWDNPFRPGGDLSREADEIVELIKGGKPITPTPGAVAPPLPSHDSPDAAAPTQNSREPIVQSPKRAAESNATPRSANGNVKSDAASAAATRQPPATPGAVDVKRATVRPDGDASQVEHVTLKKKPKCKCCVIQ